MADLTDPRDTGLTTHTKTMEQVEHIEVKIAFLERANAELSDVVFRQQLELNAVGARLRELFDRMESMRSDERPRGVDDERPPHY